jgi:hypothetical protein
MFQFGRLKLQQTLLTASIRITLIVASRSQSIATSYPFPVSLHSPLIVYDGANFPSDQQKRGFNIILFKTLHAVDMVGSQYFPLYLYDDPTEAEASGEEPQAGLFEAPLKKERERRDGLTDEGLEHFRVCVSGRNHKQGRSVLLGLPSTAFARLP